MSRTKTTEQFIADAVAVHGDKYGYEKTSYSGYNVPLIIDCPKHGEFTQKPTRHLSGRGCHKCGGSKRQTTKEFVLSAMLVHGEDKYGYEEVDYTLKDNDVLIRCRIHGLFKQSPHNHLSGSGCPSCGTILGGIKKSIFTNNQRDWNFEQPEDHKLVPLTQGKFAKVDNEDFDRVKDINWHLSFYGYANSNSVGMMHAFILNCPEDLKVDHIHHDTLDNRKSELRLATPFQNSANTRSRGGSSDYKGVCWDKVNSKWMAQIRNNYRNYKIGRFDVESDAAKAFDLKAIELRGEWAYQTLNFPELLPKYLEHLNKNYGNSSKRLSR